MAELTCQPSWQAGLSMELMSWRSDEDRQSFRARFNEMQRTAVLSSSRAKGSSAAEVPTQPSPLSAQRCKKRVIRLSPDVVPGSG